MPGLYTPPGYDVPGYAVPAPPAPAFVPDPDLLDACNALVTVECDYNAAGASRTRHKGTGPDWLPVPGLADVPVVLGRIKQDVVTREEGRQVPVMRWGVMFVSPVTLDVRHRLVYRDPDDPGVTRYLYVWGRSANAFNRDHHWTVPLVEYVSLPEL